MIYVALLRGINVGGKNKISMAALKDTFEYAGMRAVKTYIHSGNILFKNNQLSPTQLTEVLERAITDTFGLSIKVLVLSLEDFTRVIDSLPESWTNDQNRKSDVLFLWKDVDTPNELLDSMVRPGVDTVKVVKGAILWTVERKNVSKSGLSKLVGTEVYKEMTIRNVNTVRKIYLLMKELEDSLL